MSETITTDKESFLAHRRKQEELHWKKKGNVSGLLDSILTVEVNTTEGGLSENASTEPEVSETEVGADTSSTEQTESLQAVSYTHLTLPTKA